MTISDGEKLILVMLCDLYEKLGIKGEVDPKFVKEAIYSGNEWGLKWQYSGIFSDEARDPELITEVCDILQMWWLMETAYERLTPDEKARLVKEAAPHGPDVKFEGFDGNNECEHMSVAKFLIESLDRFTHFKGRYLNSHFPSIEVHRRMLRVFRPMCAKLAMSKMDVDDLIALLKARTHPDHLKEAS